ncbi:Gustatory receptor 157 [Halyomorpha halys]|nr:Gustatory receptor 157 [Halyomorpha halys]
MKKSLHVRREMEQKTLKHAFNMATYVGAFPSFEAETFKVNKIPCLIVLLIKLIVGIGMYRSETILTWDIYLSSINIHQFVEYIISGYLFFHVCLYHRSFQKLNSQFIELDQMFYRLKPGTIDEIDYTHHYIFITLTMLLFAVRLIDGTLVQKMYAIYVVCTTIGLVHPFMLTMTNLHFRFVALRKSLFINCNCLALNNRFNKVKYMEEILGIFDLLCSTSVTLNSCFSLQLLNFFFVTIILIVHNLYDVILAISELRFMGILLTKAITVAAFSFLTFSITTFCQNVSKEPKEFNALLYQIMLDDKTNDIATNKKLQLHFAMKRKVQFTAYGFFSLDYTLLYSMITATTTNLVILLQFGLSSTSVTFLPEENSFTNNTYPTVISTTSM